MMENMAFVVGAVLSGVMMKLDAGFMNRMLGLYMASRVLYIISYISTERQPLSYLRTIAYNAGIGILMTIYWKAGNALLSA